MKRVLLFLMAVVLLAGCTQKVSFTEVMISDPVRHYYPILQGQQLRIVARVTNIGNVPLVIRDIQPSCGCIVVNVKREVIVPPGRFMYLTLDYDSKKNVGKVCIPSASGATSRPREWPKCGSISMWFRMPITSTITRNSTNTIDPPISLCAISFKVRAAEPVWVIT